MANETSKPEYKIVDQGAQVTLNSENERIQTITPGAVTDGFDTKFSTQIADIPGSEDSENDRVGLDTYRGDKEEVANPASAWAASTEYSVGDRVEITDGSILEATVAGTSDDTEPTGPGTDGTVTWVADADA